MANIANAHRSHCARLTEAQAAEAGGVTAATWRVYEATGRGRRSRPMVKFAGVYSVNLDWRKVCFKGASFMSGRTLPTTTG